MKRFLSRALLLAIAVAAQFLVLEAGFRLWGSSEAAPGFQSLFLTDPRVGYRLKPGASTHFKTAEFETDIAINAQGVRDDAAIGPKGPAERRIVVLGDSLVMSVQVPLELTFTKRLEAMLNAHADAGGPRYRVINAGVQGYGPVQDYLFFKEVVSTFDADLVLVGLYVANDAIEAADASGRLDGSEPAPSTASADQASRFRRWWRRLVKQSVVLQIVRLRIVTVLEPFLQGSRGLERALTTYLPEPPPDVLRGLQATRESVSRIAAIARERGGETAVLLLPARFQLHDREWAGRRADTSQRGFALLRDGASHQFSAAFAGSLVPVLDLLPPLRAAGGQDGLYFAQSAHLTARGHEVVARAIARFLTTSGWLARTANPAAGAR